MLMISRRTALIGAAALTAPALLPHTAFAQTAKRIWDVRRGSRNFGTQEVSVQRRGAAAVVEFRTKLKGTILLFPVSYQLACREVWQSGVLQSIESQCVQNGEEFFVSAKRTSAGMEVTSTKFNGLVPGKPGTTTFFVKDILKRPVWISTQSGRPRNVDVVSRGNRNVRVGGQDVACTHYYCAGELRYPIDAFFDANGELAAYSVEAFGQTNEFTARSLSPALRPVWT